MNDLRAASIAAMIACAASSAGENAWTPAAAAVLTLHYWYGWRRSSPARDFS